MRISLHLAMWLATGFAALCIAYGVVGFTSLDADATAAMRDDAHGFAMFWMFLGVVGLACAGGSWWLLKSGGNFGED